MTEPPHFTVKEIVTKIEAKVDVLTAQVDKKIGVLGEQVDKRATVLETKVDQLPTRRTTDDHERRLRKLEKWMWALPAGAFAAIATFLSIVLGNPFS